MKRFLYFVLIFFIAAGVHSAVIGKMAPERTLSKDEAYSHAMTVRVVTAVIYGFAFFVWKFVSDDIKAKKEAQKPFIPKDDNTVKLLPLPNVISQKPCGECPLCGAYNDLGKKKCFSCKALLNRTEMQS